LIQSTIISACTITTGVMMPSLEPVDFNRCVVLLPEVFSLHRPISSEWRRELRECELNTDIALIENANRIFLGINRKLDINYI